MIVRDKCKKPVGPLVKINYNVDTMIHTFTTKMATGTYIPQALIRQYIPFMHKIEQEWSEYNDHTVLIGRKTKKILLKKVGYFSLDRYIMRQYQFTIHHAKKESYSRLNYDVNKFIDLSYVVTTMLFLKYAEVYEFEIKFSIFRILLEYLSVYSQKEWKCTAEEFLYVINQVLNTNFDSLAEYKATINVDIHPTEPHKTTQKIRIKKIKPTCADDLLSLRTEDMSLSEWYDIIQSTWRISRRSMYNYLHQFGIGVRQYGDTPSLTDKLLAENDLLRQQVAELRNMILHNFHNR